MNHQDAAEQLLDHMCFTGALAHAVLALVERLDELNVIGIQLEEEEDDDEEGDDGS